MPILERNEAGILGITRVRVLLGIGLCVLVAYLDHLVDLGNPKYKNEEDVQKLFTVQTDQGPVKCWGKVVEPLTAADGGVGPLVNRVTERIPNSDMTAKPPLDPIVNHVLRLNGIENPLKVPAGTPITTADYCAFVPQG